MTDWKELYQQKLIPVEDIAKVIPPHSHCSLSDGAADPRAITREIEKRYAEFTDVSFMQGPPGERIEMFDPRMEGHIRYEPLARWPRWTVQGLLARHTCGYLGLSAIVFLQYRAPDPRRPLPY